MKLKPIATAILIAAASYNAYSQVPAQTKLVEKIQKKGNELIIPYEKYVLPNGLTVVVHEDHSDPVVHVDVTYHVGSAREEIGKSGFAHFFEHMMFQGSDHVADEQHFKIVTEAGGTLNGSTNRDRTNYYETVPSNQVEKMLWLEADRMGFLLDAVTQQKFEVQRSTVKNERGQNYDNQPYGLVGEVSAKSLYPYGHPYSWLTIGYIEELNKVNVGDLKNFFLRWYGPNNATVTVGGDVKTADIVKLVEKYFGSIPRGPEVKPMKLPAVVLEKNRYVSYVDNYARAAQLRVVYPTVPEYDKDMAALSCLAQVLGGGGGGGRGGRGGGGGNRNSVFYQFFIKDQKALQASASSQLSELAGEFSISITPYPGKSLTEMEQLVWQALRDFEKRGITDEDIEKFKSGYESRTINGLASVSGKVSQLAAFQTFAGNPNMIAKLIKMYQAVTKEDVMRVYNQYVKGKNHVTVSVLTKDESQKAAEDNYTADESHYKAPNYGYAGLKYNKAKDVFDRKKAPASGPNPVVKVPAFWRQDLANSMKVIGTENTETPTVTISIALKGGRLLEANELAKAGWVNLFATMMNEDTKNYTSEQFSAELEKLGSSVNVSSSDDAIVFTAQTLKKNLSKTLALLQERIFAPSFNKETFTRIKRQLDQRLKNSKTQPAGVATAVYDKLSFGKDHILGMEENGTSETIKNIQFEDIQNYYDNYITSEEGRVVIVGDIKQAEIMKELDFLSKVPAKPVKVHVPPAAPIIEKTRIYLVNIPKAAQTEFRIGAVTGLKYDATGDFYRAVLANYNLGGGFNSRINLNLREDKGWTYGARSSFAGYKHTGTFTFSSGIKAAATDSALVEVMSEIKNYVNKTGVKPEEIAFMKKSIGQSDARNYETSIQKAAFIGRILQYNLPADFIRQQNEILKNITKSDIDAISQKYIDISKMNILLVGDKQLILPGLKKLGYEIIELDVDGNEIGQIPIEKEKPNK
jgi:zinc protease